MGLSMFSSGSSKKESRGIIHFSKGSSKETFPDKVDGKFTVIIDRFTIKKVERSGDNCLALINYPNCSEFKGDKLILFKDMSREKLAKMKSIDPHFLGSNNIVARFRPTEEGWSLGRVCLQQLSQLI